MHTRTDTSIRSIPTLSPETESTQHTSSEQIEMVKELVDENVSNMVIEHLLLLRSERAIRSTIETWANNPNKNLLLFLVDMNGSDAVNRVNFVRTMVEQRGPFQPEKSVVILLHYSQSGSRLSSQYPALFLGGWKHQFLDGVGGVVKPETWIEAACFGEDCTTLSTDIMESVASLMPKALTYVASQNIFYDGQAIRGTKNSRSSSFFERYDTLCCLMNRRAGESSIGDILQRKFGAIWSNSNLVKMLNRSSESLMDGTSQLSMSLSLRGVFQETLCTFLTSLLTEMNQWKNLDILHDDYGNDATNELFGFVTGILPVMPFEELVLQRHVAAGIQTTISLAVMHRPPVRFPFFYFVSTFLDKIAERAEFLSSGSVVANDSSLAVSETTLMERAHEILYDESSDPTATLQAIQEIVHWVKDELPSERDSLYERYLHNYVTWKLGCDPTDTDVLVNWIRQKVPMSKSGDIVAIHVIARANEVVLTRIASWTHASEFSSNSRTLALGVDSSGPDTERFRHEDITKFVEQRLLPLSTVLKHARTMLANCEVSNDLLVSDLRLLSFLHIVTASKAPDEVKRGARSYWCSDVEEACLWNAGDKATLESFVTVIKELGASDTDAWYLEMIEALLQHFFSPLWFDVAKTHTYKEDDLIFLLKAIAQRRVIWRHQLAVVLLRRGLKEPVDSNSTSVLGLSISSLELATSEVTCDNLHMFPEGSEQRIAVPHFVPSWLLSAEEQPLTDGPNYSCDDDSIRSFFNEYSHSYPGYLSEVLFGIILGQALQQAEHESSEQTLMALLQDITNECMLKRSDAVRSQRLRSYSGEGTGNLIGTAIGAMIANARLVAYVAKVAHEFATTSSCTVLNGPYSVLASEVLEATMSQSGCLWQEYFLHTVVRVRGEGNLLILLGNGGPLQRFDWCQPWVEGLPSNVSGRERELKDAEDALAEAVQEEDRKSHQLRHCPHCTSLFSVLEHNCGQFVCGRDAHGDIGAGRVYGCGGGFALNESRPYSPDETILAPMRRNLAEKQREMEACNAHASRFDRVRAMEVPIMLFNMGNSEGGETLAPVCNLLDALEKASDSNLPSWANVFRILTRESAKLSRYRLLPDLIEVRAASRVVYIFLAMSSIYLKTFFFSLVPACCSCTCGSTQPFVFL